MLTITTKLACELKPKFTDPSKLVFGQVFTDHMFTMQYTAGKGWHDAAIEPYSNFTMDPATLVFHYGQAIFEGLKAYKSPEEKTLLFRPEDNFTRMNVSGERLCIPPLDIETAMEGLRQLLKIEEGWIPTEPNTSLYIRPTIIATDAALGVKVSQTYLFYIILSPVGPYYPQGFNPVPIYVEDEYVRAVRGGTGFTKAAANYAISLYAGEIAKQRGYAQVLWLDGVNREYVEEVGSMNIFFVLGDTLMTPALQGSILPGITRNSVLRIAQEKGLKVEERPIAIKEVFEASDRGLLKDCFGTGTAAIISPVSELSWNGKTIQVNGGKTGDVALSIYDELVGIQYGTRPDPYGWRVEL